MSHTPAPWLVESPLGDGPGDHLWIVQEGASSEVYDWRNIAVVCSDDPEEMDGSSSKPIRVTERDANAALIAAAPELRDACADALAGWRYIRANHGDLYGVGWDRVEQALQAAIAKASGEKPA